MKEYKNIDRLFQEKFRDFEVTPSDKIWKNIETEMTQKPKKERRVIWLWISGIAAGLALLFYVNNPFNDNPKQQNTTKTELKKYNNSILPETEVTNTTNQPKEIIEHPDYLENAKKIIQTKQRQTIKINNNNSITNTTTNHIEEKVKIKEQTTITNSVPKENTSPTKSKSLLLDNVKNEKPDEIAGISLESNTPSITKKSSKKEELPDVIAEENTNMVTNEIKTKKWTVSTVAAPVYLNSFDKNTSSIDAQFDNNTKQGSFSSAYGVQLAYQVNNRFSLQSGVHMVDYGYKTYGVYVSPGGAVNHYSNINYDSDANLIDIYAAPSQANNLNETNLRETKGSIMQVFGYVEIPLEVKYRLNKGNFGINVIGGFSTLLLNKNQIFIETDGSSSKLGEASNLNSLNFSGNLGLEFDYKLYQNLYFNLAPMFKVQTNTFEKNTGGFNPYAIGVYSGLNFRF